VQGEGVAKFGDQEHRLTKRDVLAVPSWNEMRLQASSDLILFGFSDKAAQEKLNLYREQRS